MSPSHSGVSDLTPGGLPIRPPTPLPVGVTSTSFQDKSTIEKFSTSRRASLSSFIKSGPIFTRAKLSIRPDNLPPRNQFDPCLDDWLDMADLLRDALGGFNDDVRIYQYYLPVYFWVRRELLRHNQALKAEGAPHRPFVIGFSCPQGGGKTTLTTFLELLLRSAGIHVHIASLDDFYVTNAEQTTIARKHKGNPLMQFRGMPGTHDIDLLNEVLDGVRQGRTFSIPKYDKTKFEGRGDRAPRDNWTHVSGVTDVFLLEGWCLGFEPVSCDELITEDLKEVNRALAAFSKVYSRMDALLLIEISNMEWVYGWRLQAERASREAGKPGLTDEQVVDFVDRFMPAYKQYSIPLYRRKEPLLGDHEVHIEIDEKRRPVNGC